MGQVLEMMGWMGLMENLLNSIKPLYVAFEGL
jgi:hypothetical protein